MSRIPDQNYLSEKQLPTGTITFLFTDIEGSSRMWEANQKAARSALAIHDKLVINGVEEAGGMIVKSRGEGDSHFAVFTHAGAALEAATAIQRTLDAQSWPTEKPLRVRIALHTGEAELRMGDYFGTAVNRAARIRAVAHGGQVLLSQATAELVRDRLPHDVALRDLGIHRLKDLSRPEHLYQLDIEGLQTEFPALNSLNLKSHNLPAQSTSFVGRKREIAQIGELLAQDNVRLIMLTGPGGIGKTNLSLQVGRKFLGQFADGVWLVELAPVTDPDMVAKTAAGALGLRELPEKPVLEMLVDYLREKACLLLLDNCEHLVSAVANFVLTVLRACPEMRILASSREALGVPGEMPYRVPPLSFPEGHHLPPAAEWDQYDALRLFVERATAVLPAFQVTDRNFAPLVKICRRLDGIPLALELAAARVNILTIEQIANRLDDRFRLLTRGSRTALPRQQTLRALIDWSWDLLSEKEQVLLGRLSVFAGGMDLEAVEAVCAGDNLDIYDLLDILGDLVNKSLVIAQREQGQATRYRLLETIRQYAQERLLTTGLGKEFRCRHLAYFLQLAEEAEPELVGPQQAAWFMRLEREGDNIRSALNWALDTDMDAGLRLITALWRYYFVRGHIREGETWLAQLLAGTEQVDREVKGKALWVQGMFNLISGEAQSARVLTEESLAIYQELGDEQGTAYRTMLLSYFLDWQESRDLLLENARLLRNSEDKLALGETLRNISFREAELNNYEQAMIYIKESESLFRELGHLAGIAEVLSRQAQFAIWQGDFDTARIKLDESMAIQESLGYGNNFLNLMLLGDIYFWQGNFEQARAALEKSLTISRDAGNNSTNHWTQARLGYVLLREGQLSQAQKVLAESLKSFNEADYRIGVVFVLERLAILAAALKKPEETARLVGWADAEREAIQDVRPPIEQEDLDRDIAAAEEILGRERYRAAYAEGQLMTMEEACALALLLESGDQPTV